MLLEEIKNIISQATFSEKKLLSDWLQHEIEFDAQQIKSQWDKEALRRSEKVKEGTVPMYSLDSVYQELKK
jgi:hypothetical protein